MLTPLPLVHVRVACGRFLTGRHHCCQAHRHEQEGRGDMRGCRRGESEPLVYWSVRGARGVVRQSDALV
jgi:hypothetical protein